MRWVQTLLCAFIPRPVRWKRIVVAGSLGILVMLPGRVGEVVRELFTDAFTAVSAFVAVTLLLFYGLERVLGIDIPSKLKRARGFQVPLAALLGATPGCGGAVIVVAAHSSGNVSFGAVVAALVATMGDAAFLLIATRPDVAMVLLPISWVAGVLSGWSVDRFYPRRTHASRNARPIPKIGEVRLRDYAFAFFAILGLVVGVASLAGVDTDALGASTVRIIALLGTAVCLVIWATSPLNSMTHTSDSPLTRAAEETSFISVWVICAFLAYELPVQFGGLEVEAWFSGVGPVLPLVGILVGFIPGCGPQILVATLFVNGLVPFSALIGNAISNDGDALFPAIALNRRVAFEATLLSAIPALVIAYAFHFFAPSFLR